jgi:apolipoprotein N-acyltransferase
LVRQYVPHISELAVRGAQVVVIPEKIGHIAGSDLAQADEILQTLARDRQITIVASFEHVPDLNESRVYSPNGVLEATYRKHHMLPPFESHLLPGTTRVLVTRPSGKWGIEICKDMDFPQLAREYASDGAGLMLVPAWDFVDDGWLHGRMAILRGVESGFSIARAAKQGILTITDDRGRVLAERNSGADLFASLVAVAPVHNEQTFYARAGDWFVWLDLLLIVVLISPYPRKNSIN